MHVQQRMQRVGGVPDSQRVSFVKEGERIHDVGQKLGVRFSDLALPNQRNSWFLRCGSYGRMVGEIQSFNPGGGPNSPFLPQSWIPS